MMVILQTESTRPLVPVEYNTRQDGTAEVFLRRNIEEVVETLEDGTEQVKYVADEIQIVGADKPAEWYTANLARLFVQAEREMTPETIRISNCEEGIDELVLAMADIFGGEEE